MTSGYDLPAAGPPPGREILPASAPASGGLAPAPRASAVVAVEGGDPMGLVRAFRRRWPLALGLGLLASLGVAAVAWKLVPAAEYTAYASIRINSVSPAMLFGAGKGNERGDGDYRTFQQTQVNLIKSRTVLDLALSDPDVARLPVVAEQEDPAEWLLGELRIKAVPTNELVELTLSGERPKQAATILTSIVDNYMKYFGDAEKQRKKDRHDELKKLYETYKDNLKTSRNALRQRVEEAGAGDKEALAVRTNYAYQNAAAANALKMEVRKQILEAEADVQVLRAKDRSAPPPAPAAVAAADPKASATAPTAETDAEVLRLLEQIRTLEGQAQKIRGVARNSYDPSLRVAAARREQLLATLAARRAAVTQAQAAATAAGAAASPSAKAALGPGDPVAARLAEAKDKLAGLKIVEAGLAAQVAAFNKEAKEHNVNAQDLKGEQDDVALQDELVRQVGGEIQKLSVELKAPERIQLVDKPKIPRTKDELKKVKVVGALALMTFGLIAAGITFLEHRARRIGSVAQVERSLGLRLVGALPPPTRAGGALARRGGPDAAARARARLIESVDATRTMLLHASRTESIRVVMITSALKGEGKTSLSSHLATSLARAGRRTLLVDCDLRRPALHRLFDLPAGPGVCELLRGEADLAEVVRRAPAGELDVVPAGRCDPAALQMLARDQARRVFDAMAAEYDFVIVDTSPVLPVADALLLAQQVDAVIFSILHEVSCVPQVQLAYEKLAALGARVLGAVVNGATNSSYGYDGYQVYEQAGA